MRLEISEIGEKGRNGLRNEWSHYDKAIRRKIKSRFRTVLDFLGRKKNCLKVCLKRILKTANCDLKCKIIVAESLKFSLRTSTLRKFGKN